MENSTLEIDLLSTSTDFEQYVTKCPSSVGKSQKTLYWIEQNLLTGKELIIESLYDLSKQFYYNPKILPLALHRHNIQDGENHDVSILNASFYVAIGTKSGYDKYFENTSRNSKTSHNSADGIYLKSKNTFTKLFSDFFFRKFNNEEVESIESYFSDDKQTVISVFARTGAKT